MSIRRRYPRSVIRFAWPVCVLLLPALASAQQAEPRLGEREAAIETALSQQTVFEFTDKPLSDVVAFLKSKYDIQVQLDTKALANAGVGTDTTITCNVHDVKLSSALELLLGALDMTYVIRNEVLAITTKTEAASILLTRVYPVADLIDDDLMIGGTSPFGTSRFGASRFGNLIELIMYSIKPETWDESGGAGTIKEHRKSSALVISQTYAVHREISELLESLRAIDRRQAAGRRDVQEQVADGGDGLQLRVYKLPPTYQYNLAAAQGNPSAPAATQPATTPATKSDAEKPGTSPGTPTSPGAPMPQMYYPGYSYGYEYNPAPAAELASAIPELIEPASWETAGGKGLVRAAHGALIVLQTTEVHRQIDRLVQALDAAARSAYPFGYGHGGGGGY